MTTRLLANSINHMDIIYFHTFFARNFFYLRLYKWNEKLIAICFLKAPKAAKNHEFIKDLVKKEPKIKAPLFTQNKEKFLNEENIFKEYFKEKTKILNLNIHPIGTIFQKKVWAELEKIKFGKTLSYGEIAKKIKSPKASRAVGTACGKNPLPLVIPCHRVIANDGSIGGFSAGLATKRKLLALENKRT